MSADEIRRKISVTGVGRVAAVPDLLLLNLAVETQAVTAAEALTENNKITVVVLSALKDQGVQERDIQTTQLSINPVFERQGPGDTRPPKIAGFQVRNGLSIRVRDVPGAGAVIDAAAQAGGDAIRIDDISFSFADPSSLLVEARQRAVTDGKARAQQLADGFGVELGNIISISEPDLNGQRPFREFAARSLSSDTPISAGESEVSRKVTVDFEISSK